MFEVVAEQQINWLGMQLDENSAVAVFNYIDRSFPIRHVISITNVNAGSSSYYVKSYDLINCDENKKYNYRSDIILQDQTIVKTEPVDKEKDISRDIFIEYVCANTNPEWISTNSDGLRFVSEFLIRNLENQ